MTDREAIEIIRESESGAHKRAMKYVMSKPKYAKLHIQDCEAFELAISALRERMERGNGCDYCKDDFKFWGVEICGYFKNSEIRYCLHCGRKLPLPKPPEEEIT